VDNLTIFDGAFNASALSKGPAIGSGPTDNGASSVGSIVIHNGVFHLTGGHASAALGSSAVGSSIDSITITSGFLNVTGESPIGGNVSSIALGPSATGIALDCFAADTFSCLTTPLLVATDVALTGLTNSSTFFSVADTSFDGFSLFGQYRGPSIPEPIAGLPLIHFGRISLNMTALLTFMFGNHVRNATFVPNEISGFLLSLPSPGEYSVSIGGQPLCADSQRLFTISDGDNFFPELSICPFDSDETITPEPAAHSPSAFVIAAAVLCPVTAFAGSIAIIYLLRRSHRPHIARELIAEEAPAFDI
jgi:hypothetical protein